MFRSVFEDPRHAAGEIQHVLRSELAARFTWSSLTLCHGSFVDEALRGRHSDMLFTVRCGEKEVLVYLLFEHQSTDDPLMAFRLLVYMVRIWERLLRASPAMTRLPAVLPLVLHHSERGWTAPTSFQGLIDLDDGSLPLFSEHLPSFRFLLDDISAERDEALRVRAMTALGRLSLFCLRHAREPAELIDALGRWLDLVREVDAASGGREALARIWRYIFVVSNPAEPVELVKRLVGVVGKESEEAVMNVAEWLEREGVRKTLLKLIRRKFGEVPERAVERIQSADDQHLDTWTDRVLTAATLDDMLAET